MRCAVVDASAIIHGRDIRVFQAFDKLYVTRRVLDELRDPRSQAMVELLRLEVVDVDEDEVTRTARRFGISEADASVLVAAKATGCEVLTDDAALARAAKRMGLPVAGIYFVK